MEPRIAGKPHVGPNTKVFFDQAFDVELLQIIGVLVIRANLLERALVKLLGELLKITEDQANAIFYASVSNKAKLRITSRSSIGGGCGKSTTRRNQNPPT